MESQGRDALLDRVTCALCRTIKKKCDGGRPCKRCISRKLHCGTPKPTPRPTSIMQSNANLSIESIILSLSTGYDRELLSQSLFFKIHSGSDIDDKSSPPELTVLPIFPLHNVPLAPVYCKGDVYGEESEVGYWPVFPRMELDTMVGARGPHDWCTSLSFTLPLVRVFLPFRWHVHFYMDIPYLIEGLVRPPDDPNSIHPALLSAICLVTCCLVGGRFSSFKEYFLQQTRLNLERCLEEADRLTHFLWANVVLGNFLTNCGRLEESYAVVSAAARFALACGLDAIITTTTSKQYYWSVPDRPLLPPPANEAEAEDRRRLSHAIYMTDRTLAMLSGFPSVYETTAVPITATVSHSGSSSTVTSSSEESMYDPASVLYTELHAVVDSDLPLNVISMQLYERVEKFARQTDGQVYSPELRSEFHALETMLQRFHGMLPSLLDNVGLERFEVLSLINPHLVIAHTTYHGSMLLLYSIDIREVDDGDDDDDSVRTRTRSRAQARAFEAARSLAETFAQIRGAKGIQKIRGFILPMMHALNAARVFARHIKYSSIHVQAQQQKTTKNGKGLGSQEKFAICCRSLPILWDYMFEVTRIYPRWSFVLQMLKSLLVDSIPLETRA